MECRIYFFRTMAAVQTNFELVALFVLLLEGNAFSLVPLALSISESELSIQSEEVLAERL